MDTTLPMISQLETASIILLSLTLLVSKQWSRPPNLIQGGRFAGETTNKEKRISTIWSGILKFIYQLLKDSVKGVRFKLYNVGGVLLQQNYFRFNNAPTRRPIREDTPLHNKVKEKVSPAATPIPEKKQLIPALTDGREKVDVSTIGKKNSYNGSSQIETRPKIVFSPQSWPEVSSKMTTQLLVTRKEVENEKLPSFNIKSPVRTDSLIPYDPSTPYFAKLQSPAIERRNNINSSVITRSTQKRAFKLVSDGSESFRPRKRQALTRINRRKRSYTASLDPKKRKERQELLFQEFNRKKIKVEKLIAMPINEKATTVTVTDAIPPGNGNLFGASAKESQKFVDSSASNAGFVFGSSAQNANSKVPTNKPNTIEAPSTSGKQPGLTSAQAPEKGVAKPKPAFTFGGAPTAPEVSTNPVSANIPKPSFTFDGSQQPVSSAKTNTTPAFAFGSVKSTDPATASSKSGPPKFGTQTQPAMPSGPPKFGTQTQPARPSGPSAAARRKAAQRKSRNRRGAA